MAGNLKSYLSGQQVRLMMWTFPRTTATVLAKCLSFVEDSLIIYEPYFCAHLFGPDATDNTLIPVQHEAAALVPHITSGFEPSQYSFKWVKEQLEKPYTDKNFIFCKDMVYSLTGKLEFLPKGYQHLFLIRHPMKVFPSWKKLFQFVVKASLDEYQLYDLPPEMLPSGYGFKELSEMIDHVKEARDQEAIIIDSDDLLQDPKGILSALFETIGLPFKEQILQWEAGDAITKQWLICKTLLQANEIGRYYKCALDSTSFMEPCALPDRSSVSPDILRCVDASMPYYEKMYAQRLTPK